MTASPVVYAAQHETDYLDRADGADRDGRAGHRREDVTRDETVLMVWLGMGSAPNARLLRE